MGGEDDKIIRIPGETLSIKVSPEEEAYRKKYLPDPKKLTDEKLVCTVCSISLAQDIHKGKDIYVHRALQVLVCEACYNFYGDGCFSADEDGDDKYCRWCGQGGTLYLCSACNCAFCQKCVKQNLKASVLAELENDDWKCYICNPRPLFGCRTICWGAKQLNKIGKEKEQERLKKIKERLEKLEAKKKEAFERKPRKVSSSEDEASTKKRKRSSDGDSSSPEVIPKKKKRESRGKSESRNLNGSIGRRRKDSSSDSESEEDRKATRRSRTSSTREKTVRSSSEDESDSKSKKDKLKKKNKKKDDPDYSSDTSKKKPKRRSVKKKDSSDDDSSEDEKLKKKKKSSVKKRADSTDSSSDEKKKKKKPKKKKNYTSSEESSGETKKKHKKISKKKGASSSDKSSDEDESPKSRKKTKSKTNKEEIKKQETADSDNEPKKIKKATTDSEEVNTSSAEDILVKKRIKLAILWLTTIVKDISELGTLISLRATNFSKKKINSENLKSYEDVLNCVSKIKQLISGVHSNYDHIEKTLDSHLKPWKILTGLEDADNEKNVDGDSSMAIDGDVSKAGNTSTVQPHGNDTSQAVEVNGTLEESAVENINEKSEENHNNWSDDSDDHNETRALISKANETLDKSHIEDEQSEAGRKSLEDKNSENAKVDDKRIHDEESNLDSDVNESKEKSKTIKRDPVKPESESELQTPKKNHSKDGKDEKVNSEKSSKCKKNAESDGENEERSPEKSSPEKNNSNEEKNGEKTEAEDEESNKGEIESEGDKENKPLQSDLGVTDHRQDSSGEDSLLESFASRLKDKWNSGNTAEEMNLKQSLERDSLISLECPSESEGEPAIQSFRQILEEKWFPDSSKLSDRTNIIVSFRSYSSNQSDTGCAKSSKNKVLEKKKEGEKQIPKLVLNKLKSEGNEEENTTLKRKIDTVKNKHKIKQSDKSNCLSSSEEEEALEKKEEKEEKIPEIVLHKLKIKESDEKNKHETTNSSKIKINKSNDVNNQTKLEEKKKKDDKAEGINSNNEERIDKKTSAKRKLDKSTSKHKTKEDKSNCLSSSDEEEEKHSVKTKSNSSKTKDTKKSKEDKSERLSSRDKEKEDDNRRSKRSINKKKTKEDELKDNSSEEDSKVNKKQKKSNDKDATEKKSDKNKKKKEEDKLKDNSSEEDSKVNNKQKKSKDKDATEKKSDKNKKKTEEDELKDNSSEEDSKVNNKQKKSEDKDATEKKSDKNKKKTEEDELKDNSSEEDSKVNNKLKKSKDKDSTGKKSDKNKKKTEENVLKDNSSEEDSKVNNKQKKSKDKDSTGEKSDKNKKKTNEDKLKDNSSEEDSKVNNKQKKSEDKDATGKKLDKNKKKTKEDELKGESSQKDSKVNNNQKKSEDKDAIGEKSDKNKKKTEENELKGESSEEDSKVNNKQKKSNDEDATGKKLKKDINQEEQSDDEKNNKTKSQKNKLESKASRKSKLEEHNSDEEESTRSKKMKKSKESKENLKNEDDRRKAKNVEKTTNSSVGLDSSDDDIVVVENGAESDGGKSTGDSQEKAETSHTEAQEDFKNGLSCKGDTDFKLELQASSAENTNDIEMAQVDEEKPENEQKENEKDEEKDSGVKDEVDSKEEKFKFIGLDSSSDEEIKVKKKKSPKSLNKRPVRNQNKSRSVLVLSSDDEVGQSEEPTLIESSDEDKKEEKDGDYAVVVESSTDSSDSEILPKNKRKKKGSSDSDASISEEDNKKKKKRRRIKCADSSEDESSKSGDEDLDVSQKNNEGESPAKGGRKNIKKIKKKGDLEQTTIEAAEEEKERRRRIEERQKLFNQVFEIKESVKLEKLVLDFDPETKEELITVNKDLVAKMKPHQAKGVKFMWDSCFESVKQIKKTKGSGCILAHCMGLGKTFQVVSLVHTLLTYEESTKVRTVMVVCPLSTVLNWVNEFGKWLEDVEGGDDIEVFHLTKYNKNPERASELRRWQHNGGVLIMGYEMFRNLTNETTKKIKAKMKKDFLETLIDPGADLIVCDEGHMLKNEATALSKAMTRVRTLRRIVLTGTPMQNNLKEYHCMVQFVKPNLLGTSKEFLNRFVNPINNGQFVDSTDHDVKLMKRRAHVLHKMLEGLVQRFDYNVLTPFLPPKQEYVVSVCLSELQEKLYSHYLENESQKAEGMKGGTRLFIDWQTLGRVWTHPRVLKLSTEKANWLKEKRAMEESDSEGSLKDFIDDDSDKSTTPDDSSDESSSDEGGKKKKNKTVHKSRSTRSTRQRGNVALLESSDEEKAENEGGEAVEDTSNKGEWWSSFIEAHHFEDMRQSGKLMLLFAILKECELIEDKVLVFSQSLFSLDLIEYFLDKIDAATQEGVLDENLDNHQGNWSKGLDYFRLDGSTSSENRNIWCKAFNREDNPRARLFLISTRAGGLGINLTAANRVIIFDASWNPSHDVQSIFRIYRFGQKKPCYVYRFVAYGTMEEKVYERQVAKQSISNRVVDEQQVHRHFSMNDLSELYTFTPASKLEERPTPALPRDPLMAEILSKMKMWIEKYHEHDSLLENVVEEELNEEERKAAWEDYENDKKGGFLPSGGPQGPAMNPNAAWNQQIEIMRQQLKLRYANKSDDEINSILVYQVSILMRQQQQQQMQMAAQMQAAKNMGFQQGQMYGNNMMGQMGGFNQRPQMQTTAYLRNIAPKPSSQQPNYTPDQVFRMQQQANLARLQLQQMAQQQKTQPQPAKSGLQSLLAAQLSSKNYPTANITSAFNARAAAEMQRMKQNYPDSTGAKPGVKITEITDDKPSRSSES